MTGNVEIITQRKSEIVEIIQSNLRSMDIACDDAEMKLALDQSLQELEKVRQIYKKKEAHKDEISKMYEKHSMEKKDV